MRRRKSVQDPRSKTEILSELMMSLKWRTTCVKNKGAGDNILNNILKVFLGLTSRRMYRSRETSSLRLIYLPRILRNQTMQIVVPVHPLLLRNVRVRPLLSRIQRQFQFQDLKFQTYRCLPTHTRGILPYMILRHPTPVRLHFAPSALYHVRPQMGAVYHHLPLKLAYGRNLNPMYDGRLHATGSMRMKRRVRERD